MVFSFFKSKNRSKQNEDPAQASVSKGERSSNPQVSIKLAEHFLRQNKHELAVDEYLNAAQAFVEKRQTQLAMAVYRNIITIAPERYGVYETLADLYRMAGFPGDGASVLLALAYQFKTAGCDSEVKRVLDSVLEFAPDNPVLKRKVAAFFEAERRPGTPAQPVVSAPKPDVVAPKPDAAEPKPAAAEPKPDAAEPKPDVVAPKPAAAEQKQAAAAEQSEREPDDGPRSFFDLRSALAIDAETETDDDVGAGEQQSFTDDTARSFFDLQSALSADSSLRFDQEPDAEDLLSSDQENTPFSVLNVVKNIALQDPRQDTPLFHFNLGIAYMQCGDYEQAVDELLSSLYGIADKFGCYARLAECSLKLERRELACGFLREAMDLPGIRPEQAQAARKRLSEIFSG